MLTGDAGTGKTAIAEGLAVSISQGDAPELLAGSRILSFDALSLLEREGISGIKAALSQASQSEKTILFIDEIHTLPRMVVEALKPFMARGKLKIIGATTEDEFSSIIETNKAFARRLQTIHVKELSPADTLTVLERIRPGFEQHHGLSIGDDALQAAVSLSQRYFINRRQPDKSIDLVDEAAAKVRLSGGSGPVNEDDIREVLAKKTGIPVEKLTMDDVTRLMNLSEDLSREVLGQSEAVEAVSKVIRRNSVGLSDAHRPLGSFLFIGKSGVGKTKLAEELARQLMGEELRLDMSEYQQKHTISRLIGSPPGYVGYNEGGQLTEFVSRHPYCVVLFDEIEKAHPDIFKLLLQVLDYGRLTDGRGREVDFTNTVVIFTGNIGTGDAFPSRPRIGFSPEGTGEGLAPRDEAALRAVFSREFLNRLDEIVRFNDLGRDILLGIARKGLSELKEDLGGKGYPLEFDDSVPEYIVDLDPGLGEGARPIRRAIEKNITDAVVAKILSGDLTKGNTVTLSVENGEVTIHHS